MNLHWALLQGARDLAAGRRRRQSQTVDPNFIGFDKYRKHGAYHWHEIEANREYQEKVAFIRSFLKPSDSVLDLGCGDGAYVHALSSSCRRITGVDADFDAIRVATEQLSLHGRGNAKCIQMPLSAVDGGTAGGTADLVYSMDVIEHLPRPDEMVSVTRAVLAPTGTALIGTPLFIRDDLVSEYHVTEFTREEIRAILSADLQIVDERILPGTRLDGKVYDESFYIGVCRPQG